MIRNSIKVLYEDSDYLAINKPAGIMVHPNGRSEEATLVDWILKKHPEMKDVRDRSRDSEVTDLEASDALRPGIVHRLDKETSGVLVLVKNQKAFEFLKKQFQEQRIKKVYHAFVYGRVKQDDGVIDRPIARSKNNPVIWSATRGKKGQERDAVTEYRVLTQTEQATLLELRPHTGRTHQLRVHLKAINYPVVCDRLYAPQKACLFGFKRLALHARSISFDLPSGKRITVEAPYPADFAEARNLLEKSDSKH